MEEGSSSPVSPVDSLGTSEEELERQPKRFGRKRRYSKKSSDRIKELKGIAQWLSS
mgnify:CR=1 FL=1